MKRTKRHSRSASKMSGVDISGAMVEAMLEPLIEEHGLEHVQAQLAKLLGSATWSDYLRVAAIAKNVANRLERRKLREEAIAEAIR